MPAASLTYQFEGLPLLRAGPRFGLLAFGHAEIEFTEDRWVITQIFIDSRETSGLASVDADPIELTADHPLWATAYAGLNSYPFYGSILQEISEAEKLAAESANCAPTLAKDDEMADLLDGTWQPIAGRVLAASAAVTLMLAGQAHAAVAPAPEIEPFIGIIILCGLALTGIVGMMLPWPLFRRPVAPDPHATAFGDVPAVPNQGSAAR